MANNDEILNELFWKKKKSYSDQLKDTQVQYAPVSKAGDIKSLIIGNPTDGIVVSDTDEVKKRIVGALGMAMGNTTVKSMASKAIKSFPIIISDDISPETAVMVKTMMEEQYASYIDLLVSNQIINLTDYEVGNDEGNIAIQALNKIDGTDFGKNRIIRKAQTGKLSVDDLFQNSAAWQLLKTNENLEYKTGNPITDLLLENAVIVPSEYTEQLLEAFYNGYGIDPKTDDDLKSIGKDFKPGDQYYDQQSMATYIRNSNGEWNKVNKDNNPLKRLDVALMNLTNEKNKNLYRDYEFGIKKDEHNQYVKTYEKLITPATFINADDLEVSMNRSVAEILSGKNANPHEKQVANYLKDRFEKASYLLASYKIAGTEYLSYLTDRLGIPVSEKTRISILAKYPSTKVIKSTSTWNAKGTIKRGQHDLKQFQKAIDKSEKYVLDDIVPSVLGISGRDVLAITIGTVGGAATGAGITAGLGASGVLAGGLVGALTGGIGLAIIAGSAAVAGIGSAIARFIKKKHDNKYVTTTIEGWERVEQLIDNMDATRSDIIKKMNEKNLPENEINDIQNYAYEEKKRFESFSQKLDNLLPRITVNESITNTNGYSLSLNEDKLIRKLHDLELLDEEVKNDVNTYKEIQELNESAKYLINTKKPGDVIIKQQKVKNKDISSIVPMYGTKDIVAYGSVEYDKRDIKDRKFNEPLILTIKFKERYSDGKYADNELTAVIGILGVITRVPSEEMATILKANAEGKTLNNFFKGDESNNAKDLIGNVISNFMGTKYAEKLPTSGKVWANLEKISSLAMANRLSGNNNGNISNAHLVFSQKEIDQVKSETGVDYLKNARLTAQLMKKYSAFMVMVCNDAMQYVYTYSDPDAISWEDAPYSAYMGKSNADQMLSAFTQFNRMKL